MKKLYSNKIFMAIAVLFFIIILFTILGNWFMNKYSIPNKEERLNNLKIYSGISDLNELSDSELCAEVKAALDVYTNWDNLFLSDNFKKKYKNKTAFLENVRNIKYVWDAIDDEYGDNGVAIYAERRHGMFESKMDEITTVYHFQYVLNEAGEIDDLILKSKGDIYTFNGEPVEGEEIE